MMRTNSFPLFVVDSTAVGDRLVELPQWVERYERGDDVSFPTSAVHPTPWCASAPPELTIGGRSRTQRAADDAANAIKLHEWLSGVLPNRRAQRDNRLWTWLAHGPFREYCRQRYPAQPGAELQSRLNSVRNHWFLQGEGRGAIGDHALARLWWGVESTVNPEQVDGSTFGPKRGDDDPYRYTRVLLGFQNAYLQIRDRTFGSSTLILLSALEALRQVGRDGVSIDNAAARLGREINLVSRYRNLDGLRATELVSLFRNLAVAEQSAGATAQSELSLRP